MNSLKLDKKQLEELEMRTKSQSELTEWIRVRKRTVTASHFGKICGTDVYKAISGNEQKTSVL